MFVFAQARSKDAQQVVVLSRHQPAVDDFGIFHHLGFKDLELRIDLPVELDRHEDGNRQADPLFIEIGGITGDHPLLLQPSQAAQARRGAETDTFAEVLIGYAGIGEQFTQDHAVDFVELD